MIFCVKEAIALLDEVLLPRKEVIHPQLPLGMPCYDFVPIIGFTFPRRTARFGYPRLS